MDINALMTVGVTAMDGGGLEAIRRYDPTRYGTVWIAKPESSPAAGPAEAQGQMPLGGGGPMAARHPRALAGFPPPHRFPGHPGQGR